MNTHHAQNVVDRSNAEKERQLTLELLQAIEHKDDISQRHLAQEMGVALGLANSYLKRCVKKGWIKMTTAPANRYLYYLTPNGFAEKARLTAEFFSTSLALFRQAGSEYSAIYEKCQKRGQSRVLLAGLSDLTEIAVMRAMQADIQVVGVYQPNAQQSEFFGVPVIANTLEYASFEVVVLSAMEQASEFVQEFEATFGDDSLVIPSMLLNMKYRAQQD